MISAARTAEVELRIDSGLADAVRLRRAPLSKLEPQLELANGNQLIYTPSHVTTRLTPEEQWRFETKPGPGCQKANLLRAGLMHPSFAIMCTRVAILMLASFIASSVAGDRKGGHRVSAASIELNGVEVLKTKGFSQKPDTIDGTGARRWATFRLPAAVRLAPNRLSLVVGARGTLTVRLAPAPARPGLLTVTSAVPRVATVQTSIPFVTGQTSISVSVAAIRAGRSVVTVSVKGRHDHDKPFTASATVFVRNPSPAPNQPPGVSAGGPYMGTVGQPVSFAGTASDPDGDTPAVAWDFGDGSTGRGMTPTHTYGSSGAFTVTIKAVDRRGGQATATTTVTMANPTPPPNGPPSVSAGGPYTGTVGQAINFVATASDPDGDTLSVTWDFGDGTTGNGVAPTHTYGSSGPFTATIKAVDGRGEQATASATVTVANPPLPPNHPPTTSVGGPYVGTVGQAVSFVATASDPDGDTLTFTWDFGDGGTGTGATSSHTYQQVAQLTVTLTVSDGHGGTHTDVSTVAIASGPDNGTLPPDPATVAPPLDATATTGLARSTEFLYTGLDPIQKGVAPGTIDAKRAAVLRGRVLDRAGNPLSGVSVSVHDHPEFGGTLTRADGMFDIAVNGGGQLTIQYEKGGFLSAHRRSQVPWQDFALVPNVVLVQLDPQVTTIELSSGPASVARGSVVTDADGTRQATLIFAEGGTTANMELPDGAVLPAQARLHVRATEYTIGPNGPRAMPADLPPTSGYTYAMELTADEAITAGATKVTFDPAVIYYVENFLGFPVGLIVPVGFYDRVKAAWIPSANGRVIKVLSVTGGTAELDTNGDDVADDAAILGALGVTDAERQKLTTLYAAGQTLWRVPITHFTPWDCNWPYGPPPDAGPPPVPAPVGPDGPNGPTDPDCQHGSIIECQNQVLGESVGITGTPFSLSYRSDRVPGRKAAYTLDIALSGATVPASLRRIDLEISVAGQMFTQSFPAAPDQRHSFSWDGKDAYGRTVQGATAATVRLGYVYGAVYQTPTQLAQSFANFSGVPLTGNRARQEITLWQETHRSLGTLRARVGGWSLSPHHAYDRRGAVLYRGDGSRRHAQAAVATVITGVAGRGLGSFDGDGGPATQALIAFPNGVAMASNGNLYIADTLNQRIRRVGADGIITTVAGNGIKGFSGDGGPASQAHLADPYGITVGPDGSLYIADTSNQRIRRVGPDGIITTVAGNGIQGFSGDGGPATQAAFSPSAAVATAPDGSLYIADTGNQRIRRVGPDGIITTVAGDGIQGFSGDGGPASQARLADPYGITVGPDGSLYIADRSNNRIRRVGSDGIISTAAGNGNGGFGGDGGPAIQAALYHPYGVAVAPEGSLYIADTANLRIRRLEADGIITSVAGNGNYSFDGDGGPATQAALASPTGIAVAPDGSLYIADVFNHRIRHLGSAVPSLGIGDITIASEDGAEISIFTGGGRHLRTLNALTGSVRYQFGYDSADRLVSITDGDGNETTIERDGSGDPTAIVAPFGQRTTLTLNENGYLASITNPAGEAHQAGYTADGLLSTFTDPKGNSSIITYDTLGRLIRDQNAAGGFWVLSRIDQVTGYTVTVTAALARTIVYKTEYLATGNRRRLTIAADGTSTETVIKTDGSQRITYPDGTVDVVVRGPDPRWGMQAPVLTSLARTTPGGLVQTITHSRTATLTNGADPLSLKTLTETFTVNGRTFTSIYDAATKTAISTSAAGHQGKHVIDTLGRVIQAEVLGLLPAYMTYDARGRLAKLTQGTGVDARTANFNYNSQGYLDRVTDPLGRSLSYVYDPAGRGTRQALPDGREILYAYDGNGNMTSLTPPGRPAHVFDYTAGDQTAEYRPPLLAAGGNTLYSYDLDQKITSITHPGGLLTAFGYDAGGRLSTETIPTGTISYAYDASTGKLNRITAPDGGRSDFTYSDTLLTKTTATGTVAGEIRYAYNNDLELNSLTVNGTDAVTFTYDANGLLNQAGALALTRNAQNGLLTGITLGVVNETLSYNSFGEPRSYTAMVNATQTLSTQFTRDRLGRITQNVESVGGVSHTYDYRYDPSGGVAEVQKDGIVTASYTYDSNGNRLTGPSVSNIATYDHQDRLLSYDGSTYTYTANGDLRTKITGASVTNYNYDVLGSLKLITLPGGNTIDYVIDGRNRRVGRKENGVLKQGFLYQSQLQPIAELDGTNTVVSRFVYGVKANVPEYMVKGGVIYRFVTDHLGSPRLVINTADGTIAQRIDYDEFGRVTADTAPGFQPFGFAGGLYDRDTKFVRFGARDYDPSVGRWLSKDVSLFAGGWNLLTYCANDPVNLIDVDGRNPAGVAAGGVSAGAVVLGTAAIVGIGLITADCVFNACNGVKAAGDALANLMKPGDGETSRPDPYRTPSPRPEYPDDPKPRQPEPEIPAPPKPPAPHPFDPAPKPNYAPTYPDCPGWSPNSPYR